MLIKGLLLTLYILRWSLALLLIYIEVPVPNHQNTSSWFGNCSQSVVVNDHTIVNLNSSNVVNDHTIVNLNSSNVVNDHTIVNLNSSNVVHDQIVVNCPRTINNIWTIHNIWTIYNIWIITIFGQCITCFFIEYCIHTIYI
jgi:hypothetical protein